MPKPAVFKVAKLSPESDMPKGLKITRKAATNIPMSRAVSTVSLRSYMQGYGLLRIESINIYYSIVELSKVNNIFLLYAKLVILQKNLIDEY